MEILDGGAAMHETVALDRALAHAGDGVFVVGSDGRILSWNRAAEKILGYAARDVAGRPCCDIFAGQDDRGNRLCYPGCQVATLVEMGEPVQNFDMRTQTKGGRGIWLNISILSVASGKDGAPVTVHLIRDITAAKELLTLVHERLSAPDPGESPAGALTRREVEVLRLMAAGRSTRAVADVLHVSPATVRNHVQNLMAKLGVHSRLEAVAYANRHRIL
jgi:PAS domain S-box-containing protein